MNSLLCRGWIFIIFLGIHGCAAAPRAATRISESSAKTLATEAFLEASKHEVTEYSIHSCKSTSTEWCFSFIGEKQFLGPGHHWLVFVDQTTGAVKVDEGL